MERSAEQRASLLAQYDAAVTYRNTGQETESVAYFLRDFRPEDLIGEPGAQSIGTLVAVTTWLIARGVSEQHSILTADNFEPTVRGLLSLLKKMNLKYFITTQSEQRDMLMLLADCYALMLRYPLVPESMIDTSYCLDCLYDIDITPDGIVEALENMACEHILMRPDCFRDDFDTLEMLCKSDEVHLFKNASAVFVNSEGLLGDQRSTFMAADRDTESVMNVNLMEYLDGNISGDQLKTKLLVSCGAETTVAGGESAGLNFMNNLTYMRHRAEADKTYNQLKQLQGTVKDLTKRYIDAVSPKYLGRYPVSSWCEYLAAIKKNEDRLAAFSEFVTETQPGPEIRDFLITAAPPHSDQLLNLVSRVCVDPVKAYNQKYKTGCPRVVLFKHMFSLGFVQDFAHKLLTYVRRVQIQALVATDLDTYISATISEEHFQDIEFVRGFLRHVWLLAHVEVYLILTKNKTSLIHRGDSPGDCLAEGFYVFTDGRVGFSIRNGGAAPATMLCHARDVVRLLGVHYALQDTFC